MAIDIKKLLSDMPGNVASDLHLRVGMPPVYRIHGALTKAERQIVTIDDMAEVLKRILTPQQVDRYKKEKELDFALQLSPKHRYRVNLYRQRGTPALFDRCLFPELETLHGDIGGREIIKRFAHKVTKVEMQSPEMFLDIDTPADYKKFVARTKQT